MSIFKTVELPVPDLRNARLVRALVHSVNADRSAPPASGRPRSQLPAARAVPGLRARVPRRARIHLHRRRAAASSSPSAAVQAGRLEGDRAAEPGHVRQVVRQGRDARGAQDRRKLALRVVFGWEALNEKLIAAEHGVDDRALELVKVGAIRRMPTQVPVGPGFELRLVSVRGDAAESLLDRAPGRRTHACARRAARGGGGDPGRTGALAGAARRDRGRVVRRLPARADADDLKARGTRESASAPDTAAMGLLEKLRLTVRRRPSRAQWPTWRLPPMSRGCAARSRRCCRV